jgi:hypothetical protein
VTKHFVDIDDSDLRAAQSARSFANIDDAVAAGLREIIATEARRREIARWTTAGPEDVEVVDYH